MATEILMPALSPTMEEGKLAKWLVREGDTVTAGDLLAEIETDKATMEFEAADEGTIGKLLFSDGAENIAVNTPIAVLLDDGETDSDIKPRGGTSKTPTAEPKAAPPLDTTTTRPQPQAASSGPQSGNGRVFASPLARRLAADKGIDLGSVTGSGPKGRIVKADIDGSGTSVLTSLPASLDTAVSRPSGPLPSEIAAIYADRAHTEIALDSLRKIIASRLTEAKQTIPHFYLRRDVRLDNLLSIRSQMNAQLEARDIKLSVNDFIIKACAIALQTVPAANAVWAGDRILQLEPSDVAVAVAVKGGLFTPVLKDADTKTLSVLSAEIKDLAARARDRKLAPHEYQGGSFAISNLGMFGIESFDAVINPPHGAILAVGAGIKKPVIGDDGTVTTATAMTCTLSVDHRVIDGALGAELLQAIVENLENPVAMLA